MLNRFGHALLYLLYLSGAVSLIIYLVFWKPYLNEVQLRQVPGTSSPEVPANMSLETFWKVGSITLERASKFYNKSQAKPEGVIRVCALGDSFTHGDEVGDGNDYPAILQQLFAERGYSNVEVINYGNSFHGLTQSYILWDEVARPMGCDFALLGPQTLYRTRDLFFNHTEDSSPYYLHSLFHIGEDGELVREDVSGDTYEERFADYYSFIPSWKYLRYEPRLPALARSMLPPGREVRNPLFYVDQSPDQYELEMWVRLLREFAKDSDVQFTMLVAEEFYFNHIKDNLAPTPNLVLGRYLQDGSFPHRAPERHHSGFGNRIVAERYFAQLTNAEVQSARHVLADDPRLVRGDICPRVQDDFDPARLSAIHIQSAADVIGYLFQASNDAQGTVLGKVDFPALQGRTLLALADSNEQLGNAAYLFLDKALQGGETLYLQAGDQRRALGHVMRLSATPALYAVRVPGFTMDYYDIPGLAAAVYPELESVAAGNYSLWLEDVQIYGGRSLLGSSYLLDPVGDNQYRFVGHANGYSALQAKAATGTLDLVWQYRVGDAISEVRCPFLTYRHESVGYQPFAPVKYRIQRTSSGTATKVVAE